MLSVCLAGQKVLSCEYGHKQKILNQIYESLELRADEFYLLQNGKLISNYPILNAAPIHIELRTLGGKGGFGSMLRAIGAQIEKTTNREACRDLSGRRLRDINEEKRLKAWLEKQKEREAEAEEKKKKRVEKLLHVPKHEFKDQQYEDARSKLTEKVNDSVEEGFKKAVEKQNKKPVLKRKAEASGSKMKGKKASLWIGADIDGSTTSDTDDSDDDKPTSSKKQLTSGNDDSSNDKPSTSTK